MSMAGDRMDLSCRICGATTAAERFELRELMYGTGERFDYAICAACGCLQIHPIPDDLARHYPPGYYSQLPRDEPARGSALKRALVRMYGRTQAMRPASVRASLLRRLLPEPVDFAEVGDYLEQGRLGSGSDRILDVGCGASPHRLAAMARCGFGRCEGVDPFIDSDTVYHGIPVRKCTIDNVQGEFGLVMFHHSLEHVPDPVETLRHAARLLRPGGRCVVRIPVFGTFMWREFGPDWVELDPPRHLYLMSLASVGELARRSGFKVVRTKFDSEPWELAGSLKCRSGRPLRGPDAEDMPPVHTFADQVDQLNRLSDAGRACFTLERLVPGLRDPNDGVNVR